MMTMVGIEFAADIDDDARRRISDVLARLPEFRHDVIQARILSGGGSNANFVLTTDRGEYVLRVAGLEVERLLIDRARGLEAHRRAERVGCAPALLASVLPEGHCVTPFLQGRVLDTDILREAGVIDHCIQALSRIHHAGPIAGTFSVFDDCRHFVNLARIESRRLPADIDSLAAAVDRIEYVFADCDIPDLLCHNDLQIANFIVDDDRAWILDWEYGGMGNPYLDLGMLIHYGQLDDTNRDRALSAYFGSARPCDRARTRLMYSVAAFREAVWSVVAAPVLGPVTGFDYAAWGVRFFDATRAVVTDADFAQTLSEAGPDTGDDGAFARARRISEVI